MLAVLPFLALATPAHAAVLVGVAWVPPGIGQLSWSEADGFSGTRVGEFDGWLRPPLTLHGGWVGSHDAVTLNVAYTAFATEDYTAVGGTRGVSALRLGGDYRRYLWARESARANMYGTVGGFGIFSGAADTNDSYSAEEQKDADESTAATRAKIAGFGGQAGIGAEYLFGDGAGKPAVALGARYVARFFRGEELDPEEGYHVSTVWLSEAAIVLEFTR